MVQNSVRDSALGAGDAGEASASFSNFFRQIWVKFWQVWIKFG